MWDPGPAFAPLRLPIPVPVLDTLGAGASSIHGGGARLRTGRRGSATAPLLLLEGDMTKLAEQAWLVGRSSSIYGLQPQLLQLLVTWLNGQGCSC